MQPYATTILPSAAQGILPMEAELYLHEFRRGLLALPEIERAGIVDEVREQVAAQASLGQETMLKLLARLGTPDQLARQFTVSFELAVGVQRSNPIRLLFVILASATMDLWALTGAMAALVLYILSAAFAMVAVLKPVVPQYTGAWVSDTGEFNMGVMVTHPGHEVLGYAIIPIAAAVSVVTYMAGNWLLRACGRRLLRRARHWTRL